MVRQLQYLSSRQSAGAGARLLAEKALEDRTGRAVGHKVTFLSTERAECAVVDPSVGEEGGRTEALHCIPGRGGEREREEVVERLQRLERGQQPGR